MARVMAVVVMLMVAAPAWAGPGDPVVGQHVGVDRHIIGVSWEGTEEDPEHQEEGAVLGGFTLFGSLSPGGAIIARLTAPWPPPNTPEGGGSPAFLVPFVPDGRYYVLAVRGLVSAPRPSTPASAWAEVVINVTTCGTPPNPPTNLLGEGPIPGGTVHVTLGWQAATTGCPAEMWEIVAGYEPGGTTAASFQVPSRIFTGVAPPGTYYVRVHAVNRFGRSGPSNEVVIVVNSPTCTGPGIPANLVATVAGNQVTLDWDAPDPGSLPIAIYTIVAGSLPGHSNLATVVVPANDTSFTTTAPPGRYHVRVHAGNGCGGSFAVGPPSDEVVIDVP